MDRQYSVNDPNEEPFLPFIDITAPDVGVQINIREDNKVIWVSVDGQTVLRICRIPQLEVNKT